MTEGDGVEGSEGAVGDPVRILVVCTGNLCRSPLVAALLERALDKQGVDAEVWSAGTAAPMGAQPDRKLLRVAEEHDLALQEHRSRPLMPADVRRSDLIVAMTGEQVEEILQIDPSAGERIVALRVAAWRAAALRGRPQPFGDWVRRLSAEDPDRPRSPNDRSNDVDDPIGGPLRGYRHMASEVDHLVEQLATAWSGS